MLDVVLDLPDKVQAVVKLVDRHNIGLLLVIKLLFEPVDLPL